MSNEIDKPYIEKRVGDWKLRISSLYETVRSELSGFTNLNLVVTENIVMHEELMSKFDVPETNVSSLDILKEGKLIASFKPVGLWVIGANGRIDILSTKGSYILVDTAENFEDPLWKAYGPNSKKESVNLDGKFIRSLVE